MSASLVTRKYNPPRQTLPPPANTSSTALLAISRKLVSSLSAPIRNIIPRNLVSSSWSNGTCTQTNHAAPLQLRFFNYWRHSDTSTNLLLWRSGDAAGLVDAVNVEQVVDRVFAGAEFVFLRA